MGQSWIPFLGNRIQACLLRFYRCHWTRESSPAQNADRKVDGIRCRRFADPECRWKNVMTWMIRILVGCWISMAAVASAAEQADVVVADFEGDDYGTWKAEGTAFGSQPARGTLSGQMPVGGFLGKGLVNSFNGGDDAKGKLTSPSFTIERKHINFLIGGGKYPGQTCLNLLVEGKVVR